MNRITRILLIAAPLALPGCSDPPQVELHTGEGFGTSYRIKTVGRVDFDRLDLDQILADLDRDLSTWRDDSWVAQFNRAPAGTDMTMPESVAILLGLSRRYHDQTDGRFDPTTGALIRAWGFGAWTDEWRGEPSDEELAAALDASGFRHLHIEGGQVTKLHDGLMLDFSAIAKGHAVDLIGAMLRDAGCHDFIIEFGGDVLAAGNAPGRHGWRVLSSALDEPVTLKNEAIATSGSEHRYRGDHSHILDPRSGRPIPVGPPASAIAPTCAEADALATALAIEFQPHPTNK